MKATVVLVIALAIAAPSVLAAPPGFKRAPNLEPVASFVARKQVTVWCPASDPVWAAGLARLGLPATAHGTVNVERRELWLEKVSCDNLAIVQRYGVAPDGYYAFAPSLLILVHESVHLRGLVDEGKTDCTASRELSKVAVRFFNRRTLVVARLTKDVARWRDANAARYRTVC